MENSNSGIVSGIEGLLSLGTGAGAAYATRMALGERAMSGAFYAFGAEKVVANVGFGAVFSDKSFAELSKMTKYGLTNIVPSSAPSSFFGSPLTFSSSLPGNLSTPGGNSNGLIAGGAIQGSKLSVALPILMSTIGAGITLADEGASGLPGYLVRDVFANYSAMNATVVGGDITDTTKASKFLGVSLTGSEKSYQYGAGLTGSFFRTPILARMSSIMTGHIGALAGASIGNALMSGLSSTVNQSLGFDLINQDIAGMFGYIFGAAGGAAVGAHLGSNLLRLGIAAAGIAAISSTVSSTYAHLEGGFAKAQKSKGLNFAGDTAAHFTQNAVTMRERALQAMNKSHMNARSAFGQEANIVHMNRDMFSHYKRY